MAEWQEQTSCGRASASAYLTSACDGDREEDLADTRHEPEGTAQGRDERAVWMAHAETAVASPVRSALWSDSQFHILEMQTGSPPGNPTTRCGCKCCHHPMLPLCSRAQVKSGLVLAQSAMAGCRTGNTMHALRPGGATGMLRVDALLQGWPAWCFNCSRGRSEGERRGTRGGGADASREHRTGARLPRHDRRCRSGRCAPAPARTEGCPLTGRDETSHCPHLATIASVLNHRTLGRAGMTPGEGKVINISAV